MYNLLMHEDGIVKAHSNGNGKKTYYARVAFKGGVKQKFLKISKKTFADIVEGRFDDGEEGDGLDE